MRLQLWFLKSEHKQWTWLWTEICICCSHTHILMLDDFSRTVMTRIVKFIIQHIIVCFLWFRIILELSRVRDWFLFLGDYEALLRERCAGIVQGRCGISHSLDFSLSRGDNSRRVYCWHQRQEERLLAISFTVTALWFLSCVIFLASGFR